MKRLIVTAVKIHLWQEYRITYRPIIEIVAEMAMDMVLGYEDALNEWATAEALETPYACWPASRWHSEICYRLLKAGCEVTGGVAAWMKARAEEVRRLADQSQ